ncbi:suppressor of fused domain protein [Nocardia sp. NPDC051750]|uniref:suppressor of fused domain protein n=1 Tax=Nocardia sp. NPDC051750 TaxID=3364325 RepID=UPI00379352B0
MSDSQGWDAIDEALSGLYGHDAPFHLGTEHPWGLGGPDPLDGISVYPRESPRPHWHYVGYGMSELYEKESTNPEISGWGFEFTVRVARIVDGSPPPVWPAGLLQQLGRYVFDSGKWFAPGHTMKVSAGIDPDRPESAIRGLAFVEDPELATIDTPHGALQFLQVVGITADEFAAAKDGRARILLDRIAPRLPLWVTDTARGTLIA